MLPNSMIAMLRDRKVLVISIVLFFASLIFYQVFALMALNLGISVPQAPIPNAFSDPGLLGNSCRWDCWWYGHIVVNGYDLEPHLKPHLGSANWAFFPVFPLVSYVFNQYIFAGSSVEFSLVIASKLFLFASIYAFMHYARQCFGGQALYKAGLLVAFNPYVAYAHSGLTETLYFFLTTVSFMCLSKRQWIAAGLLGGLLSGVRFVGLLFGLAFLGSLSEQFRRHHRVSLNQILGLLLCPLGLMLFMYYLHSHVGDAWAFKNVQVAWGRQLANPIDNIYLALKDGLGWYFYLLFPAILALGVCLWLILRGYIWESVFLFLSVLIPLSTGLDSLPRYAFWQMPMLLGLFGVLRGRALLFDLYMVFSVGLSSIVIVFWYTSSTYFM